MNLYNHGKQVSFKIKIGGSLVSKYQEDNNPSYKLPEKRSLWSWKGEYELWRIWIHGRICLQNERPFLRQ